MHTGWFEVAGLCKTVSFASISSPGDSPTAALARLATAPKNDEPPRSGLTSLPRVSLVAAIALQLFFTQRPRPLIGDEFHSSARAGDSIRSLNWLVDLLCLLLDK